MAPRYSLLTTVYDTAPAYVLALAQSVLRSDRADFEWLLLDNGSTREDTRAAIARVAADPRVKPDHVARNLGIIGGMRRVFEQATGRYILPVDSDDLLAEDIFEVIDHHTTTHPDTAAFYSDEARVRNGRIHDTYAKPAFDPVLLLHSCYIAHQCVFDRALADRLGVYTDPDTNGSHDWDSYLRFMMAGARIRRIDRTLYFWRMHESSTALNMGSKDYIASSQLAVLQKWVDHKAPDGSVAIRPSRHLDMPGNWEFVATRPGGFAAIPADQMVTTSLAPEVDWVCLHAPGLRPDPGAVEDTIATLRLFDDIALAGGATGDTRRWIDGPRHPGADWDYLPARRTDPGYFARNTKPHSCWLLSAQLIVMERAFFAELVTWLAPEMAPEMAPGMGPDPEMTRISLLASYRAARQGKRTVYHPNLNQVLDGKPGPEAPAALVAALGHALLDLVEDAPVSGFETEGRARPGPHLSQRIMSLNATGALDAAEFIAAQSLARTVARAARGTARARSARDITLVTAVYAGTPDACFKALADSIEGQSTLPAEWLIIRNGPVGDAVDAILHGLAERGLARILDIAVNTGIGPALRLAIEATRSDCFAVIDADDMLLPDAVETLADCLAAQGAPDLIFTDECILIGDTPRHLCLRAAFDPVLQGDSSTIWHSVLVRKAALDMGRLLADPDTQWATDWEFIANIATRKDARIVHCPAITYLWRQHPASISNNRAGDPRSVLSQRAVLDRYICAPGQSARVWPLDRGAVEMYCTAPLAEGEAGFVHLAPERFKTMTGAELERLAGPASWVVLSDMATCAVTRDFLQEAARLLRLHPQLDAVTGHLLDGAGAILESPEIRVKARRHAPWAGARADTPGPFALLQKPRTVAGVVAGNCVFALDKAPAVQEALKDPGRAAALRVGWSPLLSRKRVGGHD